jgi:hypothetical protein
MHDVHDIGASVGRRFSRCFTGCWRSSLLLPSSPHDGFSVVASGLVRKESEIEQVGARRARRARRALCELNVIESD